MKQTITVHDFQDAFLSSDFRKTTFSYEGLEALYNGLIDYEESCDTEIELDVIGLCCEYTEYNSLEEFNDEHDNKYKSIEEIEDHTIVYEIPETTRFIIQAF
jgi:hypothetical protein